MRVAIAPARFHHETAFLDALAGTLRGLGHQTTKLDGREDLTLQWGGTVTPGVTIVCELAWLPRWHYQVSWTGINAKHHAAGVWNMPLWNPPLDLDWIKRGEGMPKGGWGYCNPNAQLVDEREPFYLCPLQVPTDVNMDALPEALRTPQGMVDAVLGLPEPGTVHAIGPSGSRVIFKQHPATSERGQALEIPAPHRYALHTEGQVAGYLKSPQCLGVICGNSNVFHDALLWGKSATALGDGLWGKGPVTMEPGTNETNAYLRHVLANQWTLGDAGDAGQVERLLEDATA